MLGAVYRPAFVKLIGGEPLLHPKLVELATTVRNSGISDHLMLVTNGMLLDRMAPEMWDLIDELEISRYLGAGLDDAALARHEKTANRHGVRFKLNTYDDFRETFSAKPLQDPELVSKIFRACKIADVWGCHGLYRGRIYRCPQSMYALTLAGKDATEGLEITDEPAFKDDLLAFLTSKEPLKSCAHCVGTSGKARPHELIPRKAFSAELERPMEELIDYSLLETNLRQVVTLDDCKTPGSAQERGALSRLRAALGVRAKRMRKATYRVSDRM